MTQLPKVGVFDMDADPSQIVFSANPLLRREGGFKRASARIRFSTPVRVEQDGQTLFGFSYNVSLGGLYVRSFVPPTMGSEVETQFSPPHGRGRVVFGGRVAWRQAALIGQQSPCGFGVQFTDMPLADSAGLRAGYDQLAADEGTSSNGSE